MATLYDIPSEKRELLTRWEAGALTLEQARERGLTRYSTIVVWRNWTSREGLWDFARQSANLKPVLVRMDAKRMALFTAHRAGRLSSIR